MSKNVIWSSDMLDIILAPNECLNGVHLMIIRISRTHNFYVGNKTKNLKVCPHISHYGIMEQNLRNIGMKNISTISAISTICFNLVYVFNFVQYE